MANYVKSIVKMKGVSSLPLFVTRLESGASTVEIDFNRIIPIPKSLKLRGGAIEELAIEAALRDDPILRYEFVQKKAVPEMSDWDYRMRVAESDKTPAALCALGLQYIKNFEAYGATTWPDWCEKNWGTARDPFETERIDADTISFKTVWSAPVNVVARLAQMYPSVAIEHWWADEGVGWNTGYATYEANGASGVIRYEDCSPEAYKTYHFCWDKGGTHT